jgi:hypothetical protein
VLRRIVYADGWIARTTAPPELIASDLALIQEARLEAGQTKTFTIAQENFVWIEEGNDRDVVIAEQQRRFAGVVSAERPWEYLTSVYITGTVDEIQQQIQTRVDMGIESMMLHTLTPDLEQLDLFKKHILEPFGD